MYPNRRHRSLGTVRCTTCGAEATPEAGREMGDDVFDAVLSGTPRSREGRRGLRDWQREVGAVDDHRKRLIGGGAALGLLAGLAVGVAFRGR